MGKKEINLTQRTSKRLIIFMPWHDLNSGDAVISFSIVALTKKFLAKLTIIITSSFSNNDKLSNRSHQYLKHRFPDLKVITAPLRSRFVKRILPLKLLIDLLYFIYSLIVLANPNLSFFSNTKQFVKYLTNSNAVVGSGGHYIADYSHNVLRSFFSNYFTLYLFLLCIRLKIPFAFYGISVGNFSSSKKYLIKFILSRAKFIGVRDPNSRDILVNLGISRSKIYLVPDLAFSFERTKKNHHNFIKKFLSDHNLKKDTFITVTFRPLSTDSKSHSNFYIGQYVNIINSLIDRYKMPIILVKHSTVPDKSDDDNLVALEIKKRLSTTYSRNVIITERLSPEDLIDLYGKSFIHIGTRLHSLLFSMLGGTPIVALSYNNSKINGFMKLIGLEKYALNINEDIVKSLFKAIDNIVKERKLLINLIQGRIKKYKIESSINYKKMLQFLQLLD